MPVVRRAMLWLGACLLAGLAAAGTAAAADYWAASLPNTAGSASASYEPRIVLSDAGGGGTATVKGPDGTLATVSVAPGQTVLVPLGAPLSGSSETKAGYKVTTDGPIGVSIMTGHGASVDSDATRLLSKDEIGTTYRVLSYNGVHPATLTAPAGPARNFITIVSTADGTKVTVVPSAKVKPGAGVGTITAGTSADFVLDAQEVLNLESGGPAATAGEGDLTGSVIVATKPVAVFAGMAGGTIGTSDVDATSEAVPPVGSAGKQFVVCGSHKMRTGTDVVRVRALESAATIFLDPPVPQASYTLAPLTHVDIAGVTDLHIASDSPVLVAQVLAEQQDLPGQSPAMSFVAPVTDWYSSAVAYAPPGWTTYASLARHKDDAVTVSGAPVPTWRAVGGSVFRCATTPVPVGTHALASSGESGYHVLAASGQAALWAEAGRADLKCSETPPAPPKPALDAKWLDDPSLTHLSWTGAEQSACPVTMTNVYRRLSNGYYGDPIAEVPMPETKHTDALPKNCVTWHYMVRFVGPGGEGPDSNEIKYTYPAWACDPEADPPEPGPGSGSKAPSSGTEAPPSDEDEGQDGVDERIANQDSDKDGVRDRDDLCPQTWELEQKDLDKDGIGDGCDPDDDGDHVPDGEDVCPAVSDPLQADLDQDTFGDACDSDDDADGVPDRSDLCPQAPDPDQEDSDGNGIGDACQMAARQGLEQPDTPLVARPGPEPVPKEDLAKPVAVPAWALPAIGIGAVACAGIFLVAWRMHRRG